MKKQARPTVCIVCEKDPFRDPRVRKSINAALSAGFDVTLWPLEPSRKIQKQAEGFGGAKSESTGGRIRIRTLYWDHWWRVTLRTLSSRPVKLIAPVAIFALLLAAPMLVRSMMSIPADTLLATTVSIGGIVTAFFMALAIRPIRTRFTRFLSSLPNRITQWSFSSYCRKSRPEILYFHDLTILIKIPSKNADGLPKIIWDAHEFFLGMFDENLELENRLTNFFRHPGNVDAVVTVNSFIADRYRRHFPHMPKPRVVLNATEWRGEIKYDGRLHEAARLEPETKILLFQGYLYRFRGIEYLLEVANHLKSGWALVFMGTGDLEEKIRQAVLFEEMKSRNFKRVTLLPMAREEELHLWTAGASIGAIFYEPRTINQFLTSPNKLWQYASAGLPTIAFAAPFLKQSINDHQIGWVVDYETPPDHTAQLINCLTDEQLRFASEQSRNFALRSNSAGEEQKLSTIFRESLAAKRFPQ